MSFVVIVRRPGRVALEVYGPYRSFKRAEGDAKAWNGTVEPIAPPADHHFEGRTAQQPPPESEESLRQFREDRSRSLVAPGVRERLSTKARVNP